MTSGASWRMTILSILGVATRGGAMMYYVTYILGRPGCSPPFLLRIRWEHRRLFSHEAAHRPLLQGERVCLDQHRGGAECCHVLCAMRQNVLMFALIFVIGVLHQMITPVQWS